MRTSIAAAGATLAAVALAFATLATTGMGAAGATTLWATTATQAEKLVGATDLGPAPASMPMHVAVSLTLHNTAALQRGIQRGAVVSPAEFASSYAPTVAQAGSVASYLTANGFGNVRVASNRLLVTAQATAAQATAAFGTPIERYRQHGRTVFANTAAARVPSALSGIVGSVLGLTDAATMGAHPVPAGNPPSSCAISGVGIPCTYNPQGFWQAYDATNAPTGASTSIGIFAEGDVSGVVTDLRTEEQANGLAQVPVTVVPSGPASTDTSGVDEWDMDTQYSTGMAANVARLYLYDASSLSDPDITAAFNQFAADGVAKAASASFGECEFQAYLDGSMAADDNVFMEAAAQGQTVFASAGDTGGFCPVGAAANGVPAGVPDVNYPASSPWVIGAGGTTLVTNGDGSYNTEIAWLAGGGGPSLFEAPPADQNGVAPPLGTVCGLLTVVTCGRTVPDVAMDADPNSGANVYLDGTPTAIGGTSLSSPLALGVWARLESAGGNGLGFAGPLLYGANGTAFHDVVLGDTGPYPATPGYDLATGIGTFDVAQAVASIG
jgi:pseudomonalisin